MGTTPEALHTLVLDAHAESEKTHLRSEATALTAPSLPSPQRSMQLTPAPTGCVRIKLMCVLQIRHYDC